MTIETEADLRGMQRVGQVCGLTLKRMLDSAEAGMSTRDLDDIGRDSLREMGAQSAPLQAYEFPAWTCISLNDEAAHGVPRKDRIIRPGRSAQCGCIGDSGWLLGATQARPSSCRRCGIR